MRSHGDALRGHDLAHHKRITREQHPANAVVERVRERLLDHHALDALHALDTLSTSERYLLARRELDRG